MTMPLWLFVVWAVWLVVLTVPVLVDAWRRRPARVKPPEYVPHGECICGKQVSGDGLHVVAALAEDDRDLGIEGGTAMSADFCAEHCPGGCLRGCAIISA